MTPRLLPYVVDQIRRQAPKLGMRVATETSRQDALFAERAEEFWGRYEKFIEAEGKDLGFGVDCFLKLQEGVEEQRKKFLETGQYSNTSFAEVEAAIYANPDAMTQHMHGLVFAQFLWPDQYRRFDFFAQQFPEYAKGTRKYLEIGGGHALYITEADRRLPPGASLDVVDISDTSLKMASSIGKSERVRFTKRNIFDFGEDQRYDFITMGEVVEHVEDPRELLGKVRRLLADDGRLFITTPANAPMIDHIYLFRNAQEIRDILRECGFVIERETSCYAVDVSEQMGERLRLPLMYAAFCKRS